MFGGSELRVRCARKDNTRGTCRGTWHKALDRYHQGSFLSSLNFTTGNRPLYETSRFNDSCFQREIWSVSKPCSELN